MEGKKYALVLGHGMDNYAYDLSSTLRHAVYVVEKGWETKDVSSLDERSLHLALCDRASNKSVAVASARFVFPECDCRYARLPLHYAAATAGVSPHPEYRIDPPRSLEITRLVSQKNGRGDWSLISTLMSAFANVSMMLGRKKVHMLAEKTMHYYLKKIGVSCHPVCPAFNHRGSRSGAWFRAENLASILADDPAYEDVHKQLLHYSSELDACRHKRPTEGVCSRCSRLSAVSPECCGHPEVINASVRVPCPMQDAFAKAWS